MKTYSSYLQLPCHPLHLQSWKKTASCYFSSSSAQNNLGHVLRFVLFSLWLTKCRITQFQKMPSGSFVLFSSFIFSSSPYSVRFSFLFLFLFLFFLILPLFFIHNFSELWQDKILQRFSNNQKW